MSLDFGSPVVVGGIAAAGALLIAVVAVRHFRPWAWRELTQGEECQLDGPLWRAASAECAQFGQDSMECQQSRAAYEQSCGAEKGWHPGVI